MPRLPRNLHLVATWRSPANAIRKNTQHDTSKMLRLPRKMTMDTSKVLRRPRKLQRIFWKRRKSIAPTTQNDFRHVTKHVWPGDWSVPDDLVRGSFGHLYLKRSDPPNEREKPWK